MPPWPTVALIFAMYLSRVSGCEVGKMLGMSKANVYNWT